MTYRDLSKELGISSSRLLNLEAAGILKRKGAAALIGNIDDEEVLVIRKCCLFSMLGIPDREVVAILNKEEDLKATLKKHLDEILADDSNHSQAAIVIQNIRRECSDIDELDPVPFLQHIKELKHSGGLFYDVNTARLPNEKGAPKVFGIPGTYDRYNEDVKTRETEQKDKTEQEFDEAPGYEETAKQEPEQEPDSAGFEQGESGPRRSTGYDEKWSPYTNQGFGASNLGAGNWHGWSPGYGTYANQAQARERVNNGEKTCPYPVRRFAARILDTTIVSVLAGAVLRLGFRVNIGSSFKMTIYCEIIFWMFEMMIEPLLLTSVGTTPGKWIMGIKVRDMKSKDKLELKQAYQRSLKLAWQGFGFMIPFYTIFKRMISYLRCKANDTMPWDSGIDVEITDQHPARLVICILVLLMLNGGDELIGKQALIPSNRGNLTTEQLKENVIEVIKYTGFSGDIPNYTVESRNGYVKSVTLTYTDKDTGKNRYDEMYIMFLAFAGAAEGSNGMKLLFSSAAGRLKAYYSGFSDTYCGITINNESDSKVTDESGLSLLSMLYGTEITISDFNQKFYMVNTN